MQTTCSRCKTTIDDTDCYCRHCGKSLQPGYGFLYSQTGVILLTLVVGPLSLITLWLSNRMTKRAKIINTVCISLFTFYAFYGTYRVVRTSLEMIQMALQGNF